MKMQIADRQGAGLRKGGQAGLTLQSPAKINLFLEIHGKRDDGYHELETLMTTISLSDTLTFSPRSDGEIRLTMSGPEKLVANIPTDDRNLVVRAFQRLKEWAEKSNSERRLGCNVHLRKRVPAQAGLGGASSNAATALIAGAKLWNLKLTSNQLSEMAGQLGSDVPFFLEGGTALCRGRGEKIQTVQGLPAGIPIVVAMPNSGLSTPTVFSKVTIPQNPQSHSAILESVSTGNIIRLARQMRNRLQPVAAGLNPEIDQLARFFAQTAPLGHLMSGSGSSFFGIYSNARQALRATRILSSRLPEVTIFNSLTYRYKCGLTTPGLARR